MADAEREIGRAAVLEHLGAGKTFKFDFDTFGRKCPIERRRELIKATMFLKPEGTISMKEPDSTIYMVEDYGKVLPAEAPRRVYMGPLVSVQSN